MSKPTQTEEEYFARENAERLRKIAAEQKKSLGQDERDKLKQLHDMRCPKCGMELVEIELRDIKVDRCVACQGIFFDGGEIEQLLAQGEGFLGKLAKVFK